MENENIEAGKKEDEKVYSESEGLAIFYLGMMVAFIIVLLGRGIACGINYYLDNRVEVVTNVHTGNIDSYNIKNHSRINISENGTVVIENSDN